MNGDSKKVALELFEMWTANHDSNAKEIRNDIKSLIAKIDKLPCIEHKERMNYIKVSISGLYMIVGYIVYTLIKKHISG